MKIFIIGASGLVGSNCLHYFKEMDWQVVGSHYSFATSATVYFDTLHLDNPNNFDVQTFNPDVIVHCGALTHVDYCESHESESWEKTVKSTLNVIELAKETSAKLVYISTDYVFDGKEGPYDEEAIPNPINVYGQHKLAAERAVRQAFNDALIIRVAKVFGDEERGKNFVAKMMASLAEGTLKWNAFTDQYTTAINALDIAKAMYLLIKDGKNGIYHLGYGAYFNAFEMVQKIVAHYPTAAVELKPITKADFKQDADRPPLGGLKNEKFLKEYPIFEFTTLEKYIQERV